MRNLKRKGEYEKLKMEMLKNNSDIVEAADGQEDERKSASVISSKNPLTRTKRNIVPVPL
jgi:hypothetical protein